MYNNIQTDGADVLANSLQVHISSPPPLSHSHTHTHTHTHTHKGKEKEILSAYREVFFNKLPEKNKTSNVLLFSSVLFDFLSVALSLEPIGSC